ncbi:MAG: DUF4407 domain-containing protein [Chitinophagales bacterium]|nr:DUF4407 domain-containing protein [Chitinophagales bacterium]
MNYIHNFLIYCAGSNFSLIRKSPSEISKHVGIGGVIFFTGLLAALSSGYAFYTIFDSKVFATLFGIIWGLMIFNLDRFIVTSMRKSGTAFRQFFMALPRMILAGVLGIVIAKPLELKIFEKEIDKQLNVIINRNKAKLQKEIKSRYDEQGQYYSKERDSILSTEKRLKTELNEASLDLEKEIVGTTTETTTGKKGYGTNAKRKEEIKKLKQIAYDNFIKENKTKLDSLDLMIKIENLQFEQELKNTDPLEDRYNGFAARLQALQELGKEYKILGIASLFISLLFILIEMSPVLVKLIMPKGPYDHLLELHEYQFKWRNDEDTQIKSSISNAKVDILKDEIAYLTKKNKDRKGI